jgi:YHS domain-containing protein
MSSENFMPVDPVCGIELDESLAVEHEYDGKKIFFCCNGCRRIFLKKPRKWKKNI